MMANPCEIVLVRHGETAWNKEGRLQGQAEPGPPLDELGFQQAAVVSCVCTAAAPDTAAVVRSRTPNILTVRGSFHPSQAAEVLRERYPNVDAVFSSDLLRAVQTAELVAAAYQLQVCPSAALLHMYAGFSPPLPGCICAVML